MCMSLAFRQHPGTTGLPSVQNTLCAMFWSLMQVVTEVTEAIDKPAFPLLAKKKLAAGAEAGRGRSAARSADPVAVATSKSAASAASCSKEPSSEQVILCMYVCL